MRRKKKWMQASTTFGNWGSKPHTNQRILPVLFLRHDRRRFLGPCTQHRYDVCRVRGPPPLSSRPLPPPSPPPPPPCACFAQGRPSCPGVATSCTGLSGCHERPRCDLRVAEETATAACSVASRAADRRDGAGNGDPPLVPGGHQVRRTMGPDDRHQRRGGGGASCARPTGTDGSSTGTRPGILADPGPQRSESTVRHSAGADLPTLALPSLAGSVAEAVDTCALTFLLGQNLERQKKKDEEEKKEKEVQEKLVEELAKLDAELLALFRIPEDRRTPRQVARLRAVTRQRVAPQERKRTRKKRRRRRRRRPRTRQRTTSL